MSMLLSMEVRSSMRLRLMLKARMFGMTIAISKMMISRTMRRRSGYCSFILETEQERTLFQ